MLNRRAVRALPMEMSMLPRKAPSMRVKAFRLPPASTTANVHGHALLFGFGESALDDRIGLRLRDVAGKLEFAHIHTRERGDGKSQNHQAGQEKTTHENLHLLRYGQSAPSHGTQPGVPLCSTVSTCAFFRKTLYQMDERNIPSRRFACRTPRHPSSFHPNCAIRSQPVKSWNAPQA